MEYFALFYHTVPDYVELRKEFRTIHLQHANQYVDEGKLLLGGAFDPAEQALLIFKVSNIEEIETFVQNDPYYINGLVKNYEIKRWMVAVGGKLQAVSYKL